MLRILVDIVRHSGTGAWSQPVSAAPGVPPGQPLIGGKSAGTGAERDGARGDHARGIAADLSGRAIGGRRRTRPGGGQARHRGGPGPRDRRALPTRLHRRGRRPRGGLARGSNQRRGSGSSCPTSCGGGRDGERVPARRSRPLDGTPTGEDGGSINRARGAGGVVCPPSTPAAVERTRAPPTLTSPPGTRGAGWARTEGSASVAAAPQHVPCETQGSTTRSLDQTLATQSKAGSGERL